MLGALRIPDSRAHVVDQLLVSVTAAAVQPGGEHGEKLKHIVEHIVGKLLFESGVFAMVDDDHLDLFRLA